MALNVWTLLGKLGIDTADFQRELKEAEERGAKTGRKIEETLGGGAAKAGEQLDKAAGSATGLGKALPKEELEAAAKETKRLTDEVRAGLRPAQDLKKHLEEQEKALKATAAAQDKNSQEYRETVERLVEVRRELRDTTSQIDAQGSAFEKLGGKMTRVGGIMTVGVTAPLTALGAAGIKSALDLETFAASLDVLIGDADRAAAVFDDLYQFSANTPFDWKSLTEGTRVLAAFGTEAEQIVPTLDRLGDVAAGVQTPIQDLAQIYGRVQLTGRLAMEEVNRLADRGIPVYSELARILGVTEGEVRSLVSAGQIGFPELEQMFVDLTSAGGMFYGMMEAQAETTEGRLNRLVDSWSQVYDIVGEYLMPLFSALIDRAQTAVDWFVELDETTQGIFLGLGSALAATGPVMVGLGGLVMLTPKIREFFGAIRIGLLALTGPAGLFVLAAGAATLLAVALTGYPEQGVSLRAAIEAVQVELGKTTDFDTFNTAVEGIADTLTGPVKTAFQGAVDDIWELVKNADDAGLALARIAFGAQVAQQLSTSGAMMDLRRALTSGHGGTGAVSVDGPEATAALNRYPQVVDALTRGEFDRAKGLLQDLADEWAGFLDGAISDAATALIREIDEGLGIIEATVERQRQQNEQNRNRNRPPANAGDGKGAAEEPVSTSRRAEREEMRLRRAAEEYQQSRARAERLMDERAERRHQRELERTRQAALEYQRSRTRAHEAAVEAAEAADAERERLAGVRAAREQQRIIDAQLEAQQSRQRLAEREAAAAERRQERQQARELENVRQAALQAQESRLASADAIAARAEREAERELERVRQAALEYQNSRIAGIAQAEAREQRRHERELANVREAALEAQRARQAAWQAEDERQRRIEERDRRRAEQRIIDAQLEAQTSRTAAYNAGRSVDLTGPGMAPTAVVTPDRSALPAAELAQVLAAELEERKSFIEGLRSFTTEDSPLDALAAGLTDLVINRIPLLGTAIEGFVQGGPIGAAVAVFTELLSRTEAFSEIMAALDGILDPIVAALDQLLKALMPIITVAINLVQGALQPLALVIEKVLAPVITMVARVIAGAYNAVASAINWALGWLGVRLPLIDLETGKNQEQPGKKGGLLAELQAEREKLIKQINEATSEAEIARLNQRLADVDAEITRLRGLGLEDPAADTGAGGDPAAQQRAPWVFTSTAPAIQYAVATPLVEAAQEMLLAATTISDTFGAGTGSDNAMPAFTAALVGATPVLERLAAEGVRVNVNQQHQALNDTRLGGILGALR